MKKWEKISIVLWCIVNPMLMIIGLVFDSACIENEIIKNICFIIMLIAWGPWGWFNLGLTIRDMFKRDLDSRWAWIVLVLISCGIGWIIYLIKYGWKEIENKSDCKDCVQSCDFEQKENQ